MNESERLERLFAKRLLLVSGKGGVGKSTVSAALASLAARSGKRVLLLSTDGRGDAAALFGRADAGYREVEVEPRLSLLTAEFDALLEDFTRSNVPVPLVAGRILASTTFRYFTRATPGLPELLLLGKVRQIYMPLFRGEKKRRDVPYDLIVIDAPATGHALSLVAFPRTVLKVVPAGPLKRLAEDLDGLLSDPGASALVIVAEPAELAAREAEELADGAQTRAGLATELVVINRTGRSGKAETLPRLDLPSVRVPELPTEDDPALLDQLRGVLSGRPAPPRAAGKERFTLTNPPLAVARWLAEGRLLVLSGPGGVGKTTLAAAVGIAAARAGRRVLVMTVDPARRLSQALGMEGRADEPVAVTVPGLPKGASLRAMQIDPRATFERLLRRIASPETVERIQQNRFYAGLVDSLPGVLEYMGVEALAEHTHDPDIDLIVLDTPPAARGIDFLKAPDRMVELLENEALRWFLKRDSLLTRAITGASRAAGAVLRLADSTLGFGFLSDMADFFHAFEGLYDGFKERSRDIATQLRAGRFLLVTSLDRSALATAATIADALHHERLQTALLVNRVPAALWRSPALPQPLAALPAKVLAETQDGLNLPAALADALVG